MCFVVGKKCLAVFEGSHQLFDLIDDKIFSSRLIVSLSHKQRHSFAGEQERVFLYVLRLLDLYLYGLNKLWFDAHGRNGYIGQ